MSSTNDRSGQIGKQYIPMTYATSILLYYRSLDIPALLSGGYAAYLDDRTHAFADVDIFVGRSRFGFDICLLTEELLHHLINVHKDIVCTILPMTKHFEIYNGRVYEIISFFVTARDGRRIPFKLYFTVFALPTFVSIHDVENYDVFLSHFCGAILRSFDLYVCRVAMLLYKLSEELSLVTIVVESDTHEIVFRQLEDYAANNVPLAEDERNVYMISEDLQKRASKYMRRIKHKFD